MRDGVEPRLAGRREVLAGFAALAACGPRPTVSGGDVFAAGQPAAILIFVLAPARLSGWPRRPAPEALRRLPLGADLPERGALTGGGAPANLEAVASLKPRLVIDYGDRLGSYRDVAARLQGRLGAPYRLIDGALGRTPQALVEAGGLLGVPERGARLGDAAAAILARAAKRAGTGPSFYYARGRDGQETGFAGSLATEVLEGAGWTNVAVGGRNIGRVAREQVVAWDPEVIVTLDPGFARTAMADPVWRNRKGGQPRRLLLLPELPFGWIDRPPSVNRLLGCAWLGGDWASEATGQDDVMRLSNLLYGAVPDARQAGSLVPRWLA